MLTYTYVYTLYISMYCTDTYHTIICYKLSYSPFSPFFIKNIFSFLKCYHILDITFSELRDREPYDVYKKKKFNMHGVRLFLLFFFFGLAFGEFFYIYLTFNLIFEFL